MVKYLIGLLIVVFGALAVINFWIGVPRVYQELFPQAIKQAHMYKDPRRPVDEIRIAAFYFVPQNRTDGMLEAWGKVLKENLQELQKFHAIQFQGYSRVTLDIYPQEIVGDKANSLYDTDDTRNGNPQALRSIAFELHKRVFDPAGDLYRPDFVSQESLAGYREANMVGGVYPVIYIMYEGVGAAGSENVALLSRTFLSRPEYADYGVTLFAHEFYHTLGIPDAYEFDTAIATSTDIMGLGRFRSIEKTFLDSKIKKALGL